MAGGQPCWAIVYAQPAVILYRSTLSRAVLSCCRNLDALNDALRGGLSQGGLAHGERARLVWLHSGKLPARTLKVFLESGGAVGSGAGSQSKGHEVVLV